MIYYFTFESKDRDDLHFSNYPMNEHYKKIAEWERNWRMQERDYYNFSEIKTADVDYGLHWKEKRRQVLGEGK